MKKAVRDVCPPKPTLTEANLPDQSGKVFLVTGSSSGLGYELASILYQHNAKIYVAARSEDKAKAAIEKLQTLHSSSKGQLVYLHLDLNDLTTIKASASEFLAKETRLDVLWNNAGVMVPPQGSKTAQGYELQVGTNNVAPFLFTKLLLPLLLHTAKTAPPASVRVVWVSSSAAEYAPVPAIDFENINYEQKDEGIWTKYGRSKAGNVLHAVEMARQTKGTGLVSISMNPGNLKTDLQKTMPRWQASVFNMITHEPKYGAYTELFAGLDTSITLDHNGAWVAPFGRLESVRKDFDDTELGEKYWKWTEDQIQVYL